MTDHEAVVVGSGPNGLAAAIELARAGRSVLVREAAETVGGGIRSAELTLPGFVHDVCSAVHPLAAGSPFFRTLPLAGHGLEWIEPPAALAHPLEGGEVAVVRRSIEDTAAALGPDGVPYGRLFARLTREWPHLETPVLGPLIRPHRHPLTFARFGAAALWPADGFARRKFAGAPARALFAGLAAHSGLRLTQTASASFGLVLGVLAHTAGWPLPRGGSQKLADALASYLRSLGGEIATAARVESLAELRGARLVLCDVTPRQFLTLAGDRVAGRYRRALERYRYGPGVFKLDWALDGPIPWATEATAEAATVHLGGTLAEITASEEAPGSDRPFVLLVQPTRFDPSRSPAGRHTAWAYCHVPNGASIDMTDAIEQQVERFAPGFREKILARQAMGPAALERHNPNLVGGDISGGANDLHQLLARPALQRLPYATPLAGVYLCSASTPPGGGVHGMCGYLAARAALSAS